MKGIIESVIDAIENDNRIMFSKDEVIKLIRNNSKITEYPIISINDLVINPSTRVVTLDTGAELHLPAKVFDLLYCLMANANRYLTRSTILDLVWGFDTNVIDRTVDVHIRKLRTVINPKLIVTNKSVGYKFNGKY